MCCTSAYADDGHRILLRILFGIKEDEVWPVMQLEWLACCACAVQGRQGQGSSGPWADLLFFLARLASKELESTELVRVVRPYLAPLGVGA